MQFVVAFILAIALMVADHYVHLMGNFRSILLTVIAPFEQTVGIPKHIYQLITTDFTTINSLKLEANQLKTKVLLLKAKQLQLNNLKLEVKRLELLLGTMGEISPQSMQIATVIFYSSNPLSQFLTLNKGSLEQVAVKQTVIDAKGIMGQIIYTSPKTSRVLLITDPDHQIPVRIVRTGQRGILSGTGHDTAQLNFIPQSSIVKKGDILESSGLGDVFPAGYPVAKITKIINRMDNPYFDITTQPIAELHQSRKVLIISPDQHTTEVREITHAN